ncbi:MAG: NAD(P)-dependent oxidoreductase [Myxococcota bacterium]|nr:NAD(P)-dependent oxidoreductase [Myxococcota bacterium]
MEILITGASSFTGLWFARALALRGAKVTAVYRRPFAAYTGLRQLRVIQGESWCTQHFEMPWGSEGFQDLVASQRFDVFCHHGAQVSDYRSDRFDVQGAVEHNTRGMDRTLGQLAPWKTRVVVTSTLFEGGVGRGTRPEEDMYPYGLSKRLTAERMAYFCEAYRLPFHRFVVGNPLGPMETPKFAQYLAKCWLSGEIPTVRAPEYVRDYQPVDLLAATYGAFVMSPSQQILCPSGFALRGEAFARKMSSELSGRWALPCPVNTAHQKESSEPLVRVGLHPMDEQAHGWNPSDFWDRLSAYYHSVLCPQSA